MGVPEIVTQLITGKKPENDKIQAEEITTTQPNFNKITFTQSERVENAMENDIFNIKESTPPYGLSKAYPTLEVSQLAIEGILEAGKVSLDTIEHQTEESIGEVISSQSSLNNFTNHLPQNLEEPYTIAEPKTFSYPDSENPLQTDATPTSSTLTLEHAPRSTNTSLQSLSNYPERLTKTTPQNEYTPNNVILDLDNSSIDTNHSGWRHPLQENCSESFSGTERNSVPEHWLVPQHDWSTPEHNWMVPDHNWVAPEQKMSYWTNRKAIKKLKRCKTPRITETRINYPQELEKRKISQKMQNKIFIEVSAC